jgi:anti-anti-sigma factor
VSTDTTRGTAALSGELDIAGTGRLRAVLDRLRHDGYTEIVIDLAELSFLDAAGLGVLARAHGEFRAAGGRIVLVGLDPGHRRLLALTGLDEILDVR